MKAEEWAGSLPSCPRRGARGAGGVVGGIFLSRRAAPSSRCRSACSSCRLARRVRSASRRRSRRSAASGAVIKAALLFRTAFWEELDRARYRGVSFFHSPEAAFPTFWSALPERAPLLIAWAGGPKAARLSGAATPEIVRQAVTSLASVFGTRTGIEERLAAAWVHHWQRDPFARGAYSYVAVGGHGARRALAEPLRDTLFFAGEATDHEGEHGTVAGALQSGTRAAREVLARG